MMEKVTERLHLEGWKNRRKRNSKIFKNNLDLAITKLNEQMQAGGRGLSFSVDPTLGRPIVIVRNELTGEVVRQIPNEVIVQVAHNFDRLKGVLHNAVV
jgi:uncharacterized FlaG/YvyC family protein